MKNTAFKIVGISILTVAIIWALISALNLYGQKEEIPSPPPTVTNSSVNKMSETTYAGILMEISEDKIKVSVDNENYFYTLSDRARDDLEILEIQVGDKIIVNFSKEDADNWRAESIEKIVSE